MSTTRKAKKAAQMETDIPPAMLRGMVKAAQTPRDQWITGNHSTVRAMGRLDRRTKNTHKRKTR